MKHLNIKVSGRVQGVFFRYETEKKANQLGLVGFVRNEPDGSVYIEAEGEEGLLKELLDWCAQGPSSASVENINFEFTDNLSDFTEFSIRH